MWLACRHRIIEDRGVLTFALAAVHISLAKEAAGLERAMGATGLGQGAFALTVFTRFLTLNGRQALALDIAAEELADATFVEQQVSTEAAQTLQAMRDQIIASYGGGTLDGLTAPMWFQASTAWVDQLRDAELGIIAQAVSLADDIAARASAAVRTHTIFASVRC